MISCPGFIPLICQNLISNFLRFLTFLKADKQTMEGDSIWGSKDFQAAEYLNFADVLDEWAQKEGVARYCSLKTDLRLSFSPENYGHSQCTVMHDLALI